MKPAIVVVIAIVAAGVGVAVGTGFTADPGRAAPSAAEAENARLTEQVERLQGQLASGTAGGAAPADRTDVRAASPAASAAPSAPTPEAEADADAEAEPGETPARPALFGDAYGGALADLDWKTIGTNLSQMNPLIVTIVQSILNQEPAPPAAVGKIQQLNGPLLAAALSLQGKEVPGTGVNGQFTDPAFMVNAMVSTLAAAGDPLDETQESRLVRTARHYMDLDRRRREGYDDRVLQIQRLYEEAELKDSFFREALGLLDADQLAVVAPEETRGRLRLALFSSSVLYAPRTRIQGYTDLENLSQIFTSTAADVLSASSDRRAQVKTVVDEWLARLPGELLEWETNALDRHGMVLTERVTAWARQEHELMKLLDSRLRLTEAERKSLANVAFVLVPIPHSGD